MAKKPIRFEALHNTFEENDITPDMITENDTLVREMKKNADTFPGSRYPSYIKHPLGNIIMFVFFAVLGNANEWERLRALHGKRKNGCGNMWSFLTECLWMIPSVL